MLVVLLVGSPFLEHVEYGDLVEAALITLTLSSAVLAVGKRRRILLWSLVLFVPTVAGRWLYHFRQDQMLPDLYLISSLAFVLFIIVRLLIFIFRATQVNSEVLCAGILAYLMLGLLWANAYSLVAYRVPHSFVFMVGGDSSHVMKGFTSLYFSFITLSTVGYGDIMPASDVARMLVATEAITGILFVAVLISRLVSMHASQALQEKASPPKE